jgi:hypothetical protein
MKDIRIFKAEASLVEESHNVSEFFAWTFPVSTARIILNKKQSPSPG